METREISISQAQKLLSDMLSLGVSLLRKMVKSKGFREFALGGGEDCCPSLAKGKGESMLLGSIAQQGLIVLLDKLGRGEAVRLPHSITIGNRFDSTYVFNGVLVSLPREARKGAFEASDKLSIAVKKAILKLRARGAKNPAPQPANGPNILLRQNPRQCA